MLYTLPNTPHPAKIVKMYHTTLYFLGSMTALVSVTIIVVNVCRVLIHKADTEKTVNEYHYRREIEAIRSGSFEYLDRPALPPGEREVY